MPPAGTPRTPAERLHALVSAPRAVDDLRSYFGTGPHTDTTPFTGSRFEGLGGGGERPDTACKITADDLVAVQMLSVRIPARTALDLLEGGLGQQIEDLLRQIPTGLDLVDAEPACIGKGSPADRAWHLLVAQQEVGWVTAGKLLARKRPRLLPVYDQVVRCALGSPSDFWHDLRVALRAEDRAVHRRLLELRTAAGVPDTVSALRVCDVVVWMRHRGDHTSRKCPGLDLSAPDE